MAADLYALAGGDRMALVLAQARFREFVAGPASCDAEVRALRFLDVALDNFDRLCAV